MDFEMVPLTRQAESTSSFTSREFLGTGTFSTVYRAINKETGIPVAIKSISKAVIQRENMEKSIMNEISILSKLDHPFIAHFFEHFETEDSINIIMEYVQSGTLLTYINQNNPMHENHICRIFAQLVSAIDYLHSVAHVCHRDLKAENVLIDANNNIRLIDFGLSLEFESDHQLFTTQCGSIAYAPPEIVMGREYTSKADVWCLGIILYAMAVGKLPFENSNIAKAMKEIRYKDPYIPGDLCPELQEMIQLLLKKDPTERLNIEQVKQHPWFRRYDKWEEMNGQFGEAHGWRVNLAGSRIADKIIAAQEIADRMEELLSNGCVYLLRPTRHLGAVKSTILTKARSPPMLRNARHSSLLPVNRKISQMVARNGKAGTVYKPLRFKMSQTFSDDQLNH